MQSLSGYCSQLYSQIPGAQRSTEEWRTGINRKLLDLIRELHLPLHVFEQCNRKIEPVQVCHKRNAKPVFPCISVRCQKARAVSAAQTDREPQIPASFVKRGYLACALRSRNKLLYFINVL